MPGYLSHGGMPLAELVAAGRAVVARCGVQVLQDMVVSADADAGFVVRLAGGAVLTARRLFVTTGLRDELPDIDGVRGRRGNDVLHCPYCHGWEVRDQPLGVLGTHPDAVQQAVLVRQRSDDVVYFTHGSEPTLVERTQLEARGIEIVSGAVARVVVGSVALAGVELTDGQVIARSAVFIRPHSVPHDGCLRSSLLSGLGCQTDNAGFLSVDATGRTGTAGIWAAGNVTDPRAQVITAAGAGSAAARAMNTDLVADNVMHAVERANHANGASRREGCGIVVDESCAASGRECDAAPRTDRGDEPGEQHLCYQLINEQVSEKVGGLHSAECFPSSGDFAVVEEMQAKGRWDDGAQLLGAAARALQAGGTDVLLCTNTMHEVAHISLADGVDVADDERVFWCDVRERAVLGLPVDRPVTSRALRSFPQQRPMFAPGGELPLLQAVRAGQPHPEPAPHSDSPSTHTQFLTRALVAGDADLAYAHAVLLWQQSSLRSTYDAMSGCLAWLANSWAAGTGTVLAEHRATRAVIQVSDRLAALSPNPAQCGTVILAVPAGDRHNAALLPLAHLLRESGHPTQVVDELPIAELVAMAQAPGTIGVVISIHTQMTVTAVRTLIKTLRQAAPDALLAIGGPGVPQPSSAIHGADLVSSDFGELLARLNTHTSALTERERQVLAAVADGRTNAEIAQFLGVAPATVKSHLDNIYAKTQTRHRAAAVARALRRGWVT